MDLESKKLLEDIKKGFEGHNDTLVKTIEKTVNGKIDKLTHDFHEWKEKEAEKRQAINDKLDDYIEKTNLYRESTQPMVEFFQDTSGFRKVIVWLFGGFVAVGGAYLMVKEILR